MNLSMEKALSKYQKHKSTLFTTLVVGLSAYMYVFTNKLPNWDEFASMFTKGTTITSGRWGLEHTNIIFPNFSMPWLWGLVSILLICLCNCLIIDMFNIDNTILQCLISALIVSTPALISTFAYMFTAPSDMLSLLFAVLAVFVTVRVKYRLIGAILSTVLLILSMSIYQAYLPVAVGLFVVWLMQKSLYGKKDITYLVGKGAIFAVIILLSCVIYMAITKIDLSLNHAQFNSIASAAFNWRSIPENMLKPYKYFFWFFSKLELCLITTPVSQVCHIGVCAIVVIVYIWETIKGKHIYRILFNFLLLVVFPFAVNVLFLFISVDRLGTMESFGFVCVYVFAGIVIQPYLSKSRVVQFIIDLSMIIVVLCNVYVSNRCWLQLQMAYENLKAVYSTIVTQINMTPGFDETCKVAFVGELSDNPSLFQFQQTEQLEGIPYNLLNIYSRESFLNRYLDFNIPIASEQQAVQEIGIDQINMIPNYPFYGSVVKMNDYIIVKLGDIEK